VNLHVSVSRIYEFMKVWPFFKTILPTCCAGASVAHNGIMALYKFRIIIIIIIMSAKQ